jgi:bloom syndrome protein
VKEDIRDFVKKQGDKTGIIYCLTTLDCEKLSMFLKESGIKCNFYHADLPSGKRTEVQQQWMLGEVNVLCTTIAFGLGIDKPDIRYIIHHTIPSSLEAYYQQTGRAVP